MPSRFAKYIACIITAAMCLAYSASAQLRTKVIRMGVNQSIFSGLSPGDAKLAMQQIVQLSGFQNNTIETKFLADENEFFQAVESGEIDFFPIMAHHFLRISKKVELSPAAAPIINGETPYTKFVLLTADLSLELKDVTNKSILIDHSLSHGLEHIWLETILLEAGLGLPEAVFAEISNVDKSNKAILPTFFGKADLCLVSQQNWEILSELNPQLNTKLKVISESQPLMTMLLAFRKNFDPPSQKRFIEHVVQIHKTLHGKQVLTLSRTNRIAKFDDEWMTSLRELLERNALLKRTKKTSTEATQ